MPRGAATKKTKKTPKPIKGSEGLETKWAGMDRSRGPRGAPALSSHWAGPWEAGLRVPALFTGRPCRGAGLIQKCLALPQPQAGPAPRSLGGPALLAEEGSWRPRRARAEGNERVCFLGRGGAQEAPRARNRLSSLTPGLASAAELAARPWELGRRLPGASWPCLLLSGRG